MRESVRTTLLRYRKPLALGLSLGLHLIFVLFLLLQPTSGAFLDRDARALGDHTQTGIEVQFVEPVTSPKVSRPSPAKQAMTSFTQMTTPPTVDGLMPLKAPNPTKSLNDLFAKDTPAQSPQQALTTKQSDHDSHVKIDDRVAKTPNDLWAAIGALLAPAGEA